MSDNKFAAKTGKKKGVEVDVDKKTAKVSKEKSVKAKKEAASEEGGRKGRPSPFAGKKIKKIAKEHGAREGTLRAALMEAIMYAKNTDDVLGSQVEAGDKTGVVSSADVAFAVENKFISLS